MNNETGSIGTIFGTTNPFRLTILLQKVLKRSDYIETFHEDRWHIFKINRLWEDKKGAFAEVLCMGKPPQTPFPFSSVFNFAAQSRIESVLGIKNNPIESLSLGKLYKTDIEVFLPIKKFGRIFICGKSGSGKSYTVGVLIEEMLRRRIPIVVIDRHGEYSSLKVKDPDFKEIPILKGLHETQNGQPASDSTDEPEYFNPDEFDLPDDFKFPEIPSDGKESDAEQNSAQVAISEEELHPKDEIGQKEEKSEGETKPTEEKTFEDGWDDTFGFSKSIIEFANLDINKSADLEISTLEKVNPSILIDFGQCSIINLAGNEIEYQENIVSKLLHSLYYSAVRREIPPFFLFIDEAHVFAGKKETECVKMIKLFAQEVEKFGANIVIITQKPQLLDTTIRAQAGTWIIHKLTDVNDIKLAISSSEGLSTDNIDDVSSLMPGEAIITGDAAPHTPIFVNIRRRYTVHGGAGYNVMDAVQNAENFANTELKKKLLAELSNDEEPSADSQVKMQENPEDVDDLYNLETTELNSVIAELEKTISKQNEELIKTKMKLSEAIDMVTEKNREIVNLKNQSGATGNVEKYKAEIKNLEEKLSKETKRANEAIALAEKLVKKIKDKK